MEIQILQLPVDDVKANPSTFLFLMITKCKV